MNFCANNSINNYDDRYEEWSERIWENLLNGVKPVYGNPISDKIAFVIREIDGALEELNILEGAHPNYYEKKQKIHERLSSVYDIKDAMIYNRVWEDIIKNTPPDFKNPDAKRIAEILTAQQNGDPTFSSRQEQFILHKCGLAPYQ